MKIWIALSQSYATQKSPWCGQVSTAATCPSRTREMVEDQVFWYEAEVLRQMNVPMLKESWEEDRRKTLFYQNPWQNKDKLYE